MLLDPEPQRPMLVHGSRLAAGNPPRLPVRVGNDPIAPAWRRESNVRRSFGLATRPRE